MDGRHLESSRWLAALPSRSTPAGSRPVLVLPEPIGQTRSRCPIFLHTTAHDRIISAAEMTTDRSFPFRSTSPVARDQIRAYSGTLDATPSAAPVSRISISLSSKTLLSEAAAMGK